MADEKQNKRHRPTDMTNLKKASDLKASGYATLVHASKYKNEIDDMIINQRWSSKVIVNELVTKHPKDQHPSYYSIDNYRRKYIDAKTAVRVGEDIKAKYIGAMGEFDTYLKTLTLYKLTLEAVVKSMVEGPESQLSMPTDAVTKRLAQVESMGQFVFKMETELGLREKTPDKWEGTLNDDRDNKNEIDAGAILKELKLVRDRIERRSRGPRDSKKVDNPDREKGDNTDGSDGPESVHSGHVGVQEQSTSHGVVQDTGGEVSTGQENQEDKETDK